MVRISRHFAIWDITELDRGKSMSKKRRGIKMARCCIYLYLSLRELEGVDLDLCQLQFLVSVK